MQRAVAQRQRIGGHHQWGEPGLRERLHATAVGGVPHPEAVTVGEGDECGEVHRVVGGFLYAVRQVARLIPLASQR